MVQPQFLSHAQVMTPVPQAPQRPGGSGAFTAIAIVIIVLIGALTAGVIILDKVMASRLEEKHTELETLEKELEIPSIYRAQELAERIKSARALLDEHVYGSQVFNFVEQSTIDSVAFTTFDYNDEKIHVNAIAPGFLAFAQQIGYYRHLPAVEYVTFANPTLTDTGQVTFSVEIKLKHGYIRSKPTSLTATPVADTPLTTPAPEAGGESNL